MSYSVQTRWGGSERCPSEARMRAILAELDTLDPEHPDTWLSHETGWTITVAESGVAVWENLRNDSSPRYQDGVSREQALRLWLLLSKGDLGEIERQPWKDGQGPPVSEEKRERLQKEAADITLKMQRDFYDTLGEEDTSMLCRRPGCTRGTVKFSLLCRPHHFESLFNHPCPFSD